MEQSLEQIVAANLAELRRARGWTQAELAEKINYSDKSVSKWERGDGLPDLKVLVQLADLYEVALDTFVTQDAAHKIEQVQKPRGRLSMRILCELLAVSIVFLVATVVYVLFSFLANRNPWTLFLWALPLSFAIMTALNLRWTYRVCAMVFCSLLSWSFLTALYLQLLPYNLWMLFLVGIPAQAAIVLFSQYRRKKNKQKST